MRGAPSKSRFPRVLSEHLTNLLFGPFNRHPQPEAHWHIRGGPWCLSAIGSKGGTVAHGLSIKPQALRLAVTPAGDERSQRRWLPHGDFQWRPVAQSPRACRSCDRPQNTGTMSFADRPGRGLQKSAFSAADSEPAALLALAATWERAAKSAFFSPLYCRQLRSVG